jgi:hypothetical protein
MLTCPRCGGFIDPVIEECLRCDGVAEFADYLIETGRIYQ